MLLGDRLGMTHDPKRSKSFLADARSVVMLLSTAVGSPYAGKATQNDRSISSQRQLVDGGAQFASLGPAQGGSVTFNIVPETGHAVRGPLANSTSGDGRKYFFWRTEKNMPPFAIWSGTLWA